MLLDHARQAADVTLADGVPYPAFGLASSRTVDLLTALSLVSVIGGPPAETREIVAMAYFARPGGSTIAREIGMISALPTRRLGEARKPVGRWREARKANMSASLYGNRPPVVDAGDPARTSGPGVSCRVIRLDPGLFALSMVPGTIDRGIGLPAVRVSLPPGPPGRRDIVSVSTLRADGWMTANDEPTLLCVPAGSAEVLVTLYWSTAESGGAPPMLQLMRLNADPASSTPAGSPSTAATAARSPIIPARAAEIVAHIEGVGDVEGKIGDWIGARGSGRAIEGFSLTPTTGIAAEDFEIRAVLGRDWLSPWLPGGSFCGSRGLALPLRGFCLRLYPQAAARMELAIFARFVDGSEIGPVGSDRICASPNLAALEALRVVPRPRVA
jgi:hypothetical protein